MATDEMKPVRRCADCNVRLLPTEHKFGICCTCAYARRNASDAAGQMVKHVQHCFHCVAGGHNWTDKLVDRVRFAHRAMGLNDPDPLLSYELAKLECSRMVDASIRTVRIVARR